MKNNKINLNDIKHFFVKKTQKNKIITKRILGMTFKYTHGEFYKSYCSLLEYLKPYSNEPIENILNNFEKKSIKKYISVDEFLIDQAKLTDIVNKIDATKLKPATGKLREIQLNELEFSKLLLDDIKKNTNLKPFMDGGTLLGAVRHKGFIPWDDDVDFALERGDFIKLENYLKTKYLYIDTSKWTRQTYNENLLKALQKYPNQIFCLKRPTSFKCYLGTTDNYAVCDFVALDCYNNYHNAYTIQQYAKNVKTVVHDQLSEFQDIFNYYQQEINKNSNIVKYSNVLAAGIDNYDFYFYQFKGIRQRRDIYPLIKMKFEDTEFWAPNNPHEYLKTIFDFYNKIPINITILKHRKNTKENIGIN